ncbi:cytochrome P450 [Armillaria luteobubalina]|uniref:Cytochrome P450 n=1 Tax=Armillaria luteobubalina TaxID=153913 RepID=A0AA39Q5R4_9AGAR|nr:cytochrome P450 [Armillaria luteobubalina]
MAVAKRLATPTDRTDLLSKLQAGKDERAEKSLLPSSHAPHSRFGYHVQKLNDSVSTADEVKNLPYLDACINEGLRLHSTSALGLPQIVPEGRMSVHGHFFPEGAILSMPSYTIHRDPEVWGDDVEEYRPERWFERDNALIQKTFNPFSLGPRACVGRNLASLELQIIVSSVLRRFDFVLEDPSAAMVTVTDEGGFLEEAVEM